MKLNTVLAGFGVLVAGAVSGAQIAQAEDLAKFWDAKDGISCGAQTAPDANQIQTVTVSRIGNKYVAKAMVSNMANVPISHSGPVTTYEKRGTKFVVEFTADKSGMKFKLVVDISGKGAFTEYRDAYFPASVVAGAGSRSEASNYVTCKSAYNTK